ncbi:uncharacterized protein LOC133309723 [Gastrolobium bilobum]|uniref:uncharacterized protein LOC133309723 n=1 Tax=Gastrolobium bilobum TaxID=150636 RepID=UPI002AB2D5DA|nr:uncharacterized protein LOC133309723 [Gastrolobium bilobum]
MAFLSYENRRDSGKKLKVHFDLPEDDDDPIANQKHSSSSISSDSSDSSDDDSIDNFETKDAGLGSPVWSFQSGSVTQSPPIQYMSPNGYDPNRIPSSVFSRPASPMEWSLTSNESLFSLHLGNSSFSMDHAFMFRSGELLPMPPALPPAQEVTTNDKKVYKERHSVSSDSSDKASDLVEEDDHKKTSDETADGLVVKDDRNHETEDLAVQDDCEKTSNETEDLVEKDDQRKTETSTAVETTVLDKTPDDDHSKETINVPREESKNYASVSYRSIESDISTRSFQFPILTADGGRTSFATVESVKQDKIEQQQPEKPLPPPNPETETAKSQELCIFHKMQEEKEDLAWNTKLPGAALV